jgi:hypothetical protein
VVFGKRINLSLKCSPPPHPISVLPPFNREIVCLPWFESARTSRTSDRLAGRLARQTGTRTSAAGQKPLDHQRRCTHCHSIRANTAKFDRYAAHWIAEGLCSRCLLDTREEARAEQLCNPPTDDDAFGVEQVHEVCHADAENLSRFIQDSGRLLTTFGRGQKIAQ